MRTVLPVILLLLLALPAAAGERCPLLVTVDDLPIAAGGLHPDPAERLRITDGLLAALERHHIPAVGLVTWNNINREGDLELLERWLAAGHELGNHSARHLDYNRTDADVYIADIEAARQRLAPFLEERGSGLRFFRFPMLREGDTPEKLAAMRDFLASNGQRNLPVTIDNSDYDFARRWVEADRAGDVAARRRIVEQYHEMLHFCVHHHRNTARRMFAREVPQILLLHANAIGVEEWDRLFTWLEGEGFRFATVDEVLADPAFNEPHDYVGPRGVSLWDRLKDRNRRREAREAVESLIAEQTAAWNRGDLEGFCAGYHEDAVFVTANGLTHGRQALMERYRRRYPDRAAMGLLTLEVRDVRPLSGIEVSELGNSFPGGIHAVSVAARWLLEGMSGAPAEGGERTETAEGMTLLVFERDIRGRWSIVRDASF